MWIALFTSESGDDYVLGPFENEPSQDDLYQVFSRDCPEEAEYSVLMVGKTFKVINLFGEPKTVLV